MKNFTLKKRNKPRKCALNFVQWETFPKKYKSIKFWIRERITEIKELQIGMIGNEDITRKDLEKKVFHLSQHDLKKFAVNLIAAIKELWIKN